MSKLLPEVYLGLALAGLIITWVLNVIYMADAGPDLVGFFAAGFANPAVASLTTDLLVATLCGLTFFVVEGRRLGMRHLWVYVLLAACVAFSFALAMFLLVRQRHLAKGAR